MFARFKSYGHRFDRKDRIEWKVFGRGMRLFVAILLPYLKFNFLGPKAVAGEVCHQWRRAMGREREKNGGWNRGKGVSSPISLTLKRIVNPSIALWNNYNRMNAKRYFSSAEFYYFVLFASTYYTILKEVFNLTTFFLYIFNLIFDYMHKNQDFRRDKCEYSLAIKSKILYLTKNRMINKFDEKIKKRSKLSNDEYHLYGKNFFHRKTSSKSPTTPQHNIDSRSIGVQTLKRRLKKYICRNLETRNLGDASNHRESGFARFKESG